MAGFVGGKQLEYCFAEGFTYGDYEPSTAKERILLNPQHLEMQQVLSSAMSPSYSTRDSCEVKPANNAIHLSRHPKDNW